MKKFSEYYFENYDQQFLNRSTVEVTKDLMQAVEDYMDTYVTPNAKETEDPAIDRSWKIVSQDNFRSDQVNLNDDYDMARITLDIPIRDKWKLGIAQDAKEAPASSQPSWEVIADELASALAAESNPSRTYAIASYDRIKSRMALKAFGKAKEANK
jgi:hypothetical protein